MHHELVSALPYEVAVSSSADASRESAAYRAKEANEVETGEGELAVPAVPASAAVDEEERRDEVCRAEHVKVARHGTGGSHGLKYGAVSKAQAVLKHQEVEDDLLKYVEIALGRAETRHVGLAEPNRGFSGERSEVRCKPG